MKTENQIILLLVLLIFVITILTNFNTTITGFATEEPPSFHEFYGTAKCLDGNNIIDGKIILAKISNGTDTNSYQAAISAGEYDILVEGFSSESSSGSDTINFYLGSELLQQDIEFQYLGETELNLVSSDNANCQVTSTPPSNNGGSTTKKQCNDNIDNDNDSCIDYPDDPGCTSSTDNSEGTLNCTKKITCTNECLINEKKCSSDSSYKTCSDIDSDSCLEWSTIKNCGENYICKEGNCVVKEPEKIITKFYKADFLKWIIPILIILIVLFLMISSHLNKNKVLKKEVKPEVMPILSSKKAMEPYIQAKLRQGSNVKEIRKDLIKQGYSPKTIDPILNQYK